MNKRNKVAVKRFLALMLSVVMVLTMPDYGGVLNVYAQENQADTFNNETEVSETEITGETKSEEKKSEQSTQMQEEKTEESAQENSKSEEEKIESTIEEETEENITEENITEETSEKEETTEKNTEVNTTEETSEEVNKTEEETEEIETEVIENESKEIVSPEVNGNEVTFRYYSTSATSVSLAGTMNDWSTTADVMTKDDDGIWSITKTLDDGVYEYKFVIGSNWENDPNNPYGLFNDNSIVSVGKSIVSPEINGTEVTFRYYSTSASTVNLAGSMNSWSTTADMMTKDDNGIWSITKTLEPGTYTYKFVVDGGWITDPNNKNTASDGNSTFTIIDQSAPTIVSPEINGTEVTFRYYSPDVTSVHLAGTMTEWATNAKLMIKNEADVWEITETLSVGVHTYKYILNKGETNEGWTADPNNLASLGDYETNSTVIISGLKDAAITVQKGKENDLSVQLDYVKEDGTATKVDVTYEVADTAVAGLVTIDNDNHKINISNEYTETELELIATDGNGNTSTVIVTVTEELYVYTVYAYSPVETHMSLDTAALTVWDEAKETELAASELQFTEKETLTDGREWLKTEVKVSYSNKVGFKLGGEKETFTSSELYFENIDKKENVDIYIIEGKNELYTSLDDVPDVSQQRYLVVEYTKTADGLKEEHYAYTWNCGYEAGQYAFKEINGKYIAKIALSDSSVDLSIGFIVKKGLGWDAKDGGDNLITIKADQKITKVQFADGEVTKTFPDNMGSKIDRSEETITFYYRDDDKFANGNLESLDGKVNLVMKTGDTELDGIHAMSYDADNERYYKVLDLKSDTDYCYYFKVDGTKYLDAFNERTTIIDSTEYSIIRNKSYEVNLTASVKYPTMDYNDNNVLYIEYDGKDGADITGFVPEKIYADLSQLGLESKVEIDTELNALTIGCKQSVSLGEKTINITLIDNCENEYTATTTVEVTERTKAANTEDKLGDFDWDEAVIYFAVTDRFFDGNTGNNTVTEGYNDADTTDKGRYHGGDFAGLTKKIDYLYDLGVNTIWITPIVDNVDGDVGSDDPDTEYYAYHGYWAEDFTALNPHLGTEEEFEALIEAAHAKGMKIMVDVVLNHAGYDTDIDNVTEHFNTIISDGNGGYVDMIRDANAKDPALIKEGLSGLPDFLTENEEVRNQLIEWQTEWMTKYDIDYYRVDTVKHVEETTWEAFKNALTEKDADFKLIGEYYDAAFGNTYGYLDSGKMDSLLDFGFKYYAQDFVGGSISAVEGRLASRNNGIDNTATLGGFLSSHDEDGLLYKLKNKEDDDTWAEAQMKVAASLQITAKGQPVIYYGEEIGLSGANNWPYYDNRPDFNWETLETQKADDTSFYNHYKKMLNIRCDYSEVFAKGTRSFVTGSDSEGYEVIRRSHNGKNIYVGLNIWGDDKETTFDVLADAGSIYTDLYSGATYTVSDTNTVTVTIPGARKGGTVVLALTDGNETEIKDTNTITVKLHYYREDGKYTTDNGDWNVWMWSEGAGGAQYDFVKENNEMVATMQVIGRTTNKIGYIVRLGDWKQKEGNGSGDFGDRFIDVSDVVSGTVHYYVTSGVEEGRRVLGADAIKGSKIVKATYERETNKVIVITSQPISQDAATAFTITRSDGTDIKITNADVSGNTYILTIETDLTAMSELTKSYIISYDGYDYSLNMPNIYSSEEFENQYTYSGSDLGATWTKDSTTFKVWAPTADTVQVALYESGTAGTNDRIKTIDMTKGEKGVWSAVENSDIKGKYYTYLVTVDNKINEACDPYARTTGVNGKRAMVIDLDSTDPEGWDSDESPNKGMTYTDAIIYELHVRDASIDESSGVSAANKGKFLGLTETGTKTSGGVSTVLDHIADMGVTHVHLLPVYDYGSVDETKLDTPQFNWGYDPVNFNVPEGSYSTDPYNGDVRVKEMKEMVMALHEKNINVVMDVVYNHVYDADTFSVNQIVPKYFSRTKEDGSYNGDTGCGNTTASERSMVQKYIVDSVMYWAEEYHIDGFRFDLVGLIDTQTMNAVIEAVHAKYPDVIFYGEGWDMSSGITKDGYDMAIQKNAAKTPKLAFFNDTFRDNLAGKDTNGEGFVMNYAGKEEVMAQCFTATTSWCPQPTQTVNYASCHDNYTLKDKLNGAAKASTEADRIKMNNLAAAMYMMSEGIPLIHAGEEFLRTKIDEKGEVIHNSYNSSDFVNKLRWSNLENETYANVADYYKGLIEFRKNHESLRLTSNDAVSANVEYKWVDSNVILFNIKGKASVSGEVSDGIVAIFNATTAEKEIDLANYGVAEGEWKVCINDVSAGTDVIANITDRKVKVAPISAMVLVQGETVDNDSVYLDNSVKKIKPKFDSEPVITGTYGQQVKDMTVSQVVSTNNVAGNWSIAESETEIASVGTETKYKVVFTPENKEKYSVVTKYVGVTVTPRELESEGITVEVTGTYAYDAQEKKASVTITDTVAPITESDYDLSYENNVNIGENTAKVIITGKGNYTGKVGKTFSIVKGNAEIIIESGKESYSVRYKDSSFKLEGITAKGDGVLSYEVTEGTDVVSVTANGMVSNKKIGNAVITVSQSETANYNKAEDKNISITVGKALAAPNMPGTTISASKSCEKVVDVVLPDYWKWITDDRDKALIEGVAVTATAEYTREDKDCYETVTVLIAITRSSCEHTITETLNEKNATCTENGYTGDVYCTVCKELVMAGSVIPALGHSWDSGVVTEEPDFGKEGIKFYTCIRCSETKTEIIPAIVPKEGIWVAEVADYDYTGKAIKPVVKVYSGMTILTLGKDYTVTYKNNMKAAAKTDEKAPTITVKGKGNYKSSAEVKFNISPVDMGSASIKADDIVMAYNKGKELKAKPVIYFNGKKLTAKDYDISGNKQTTVGKHTITITGKGNFVGTKDIGFEIVDSTTYVLMSKVKVTVKTKSKEYTGQPVTTEIKVTYKGKELAPEEYIVEYTDNVNVGKATIVVKGRGKYVGTKKATFNITGTAIKKADINGIDTTNGYLYTGDKVAVNNLTLTYNGTELVEGTHYTVQYANNVKAGKATITISGKAEGGFSGTVKKKFNINKKNVKDADVLLKYEESIPFSKGGAIQSLTVTYNGKQLVAGTDYTVSYKNNKQVTTESTALNKMPSFTISGKGNFQGKTDAKTFVVVPKSVSEVNISVSDIKQAGKGKWKSKVTVTDVDGKKLVANKDYDKKISYKLEGSEEELKSTDAVEAGKNIVVTITAKAGSGYIEGTTKAAVYRITQESFAKVKVKSVKSQPYTGEVITLDNDDIEMYFGDERLVLGTDYEIVGYSKNITKGKASVILKGLNRFGGIKTVKFNITARDIEF